MIMPRKERERAVVIPLLITSVFEALRLTGTDRYSPDETLDFEPTTAAPGSLEKIEVLRQRLEQGKPLWHSQDSRMCQKVTCQEPPYGKDGRSARQQASPPKYRKVISEFA